MATEWMFFWTIFLDFIAYFIMVYCLKVFLANENYLYWLKKFFIQMKDRLLCLSKIFVFIGKSLLLFLLPDYYFSKKVKDKIEEEKYYVDLKTFIQNNNIYNLGLSSIFFVAYPLLLSLSKEGTDWYVLLFTLLALIRMISRSFEIGYAFSKDILGGTEKNKSGLNKAKRIELALKSYLEIYIYSATAYMAVYNKDIFEAITISLNVGTLTNVGYIFAEKFNCYDFQRNLVFIQVFATLSLVVFSLAGYLSRPDKVVRKRKMLPSTLNKRPNKKHLAKHRPTLSNR